MLMFYKSKSDLISWILLFVVVLLLIELTFFDGGLLFSLGISAAFIYYGKKKWQKKIGKIALIIGVITAIVTIINMFAFKLFLLAILASLIYKFVQSKKNPVIYTPTFDDSDKRFEVEKIHSKQLLFKNNVLGGQKTPEHVYEWEDVNIQTGIGDAIIDLSNTVLPKGESVISVRNFVGNIKVFVPYELEVKVAHSVILGTITILQNNEQRLFNQSVQYSTGQYEGSEHKIKIITSSVVGNLEVKRI
jgi:lia operon protein LiaF